MHSFSPPPSLSPPAAGKAAPQTNDVDVDSRGLIYIVGRYAGLEVLELKR